MNQTVVVQEQKPLSPQEIRQQVNTIQLVLREVMQEGTHFGTIPGTKTPSLYKPGAEKIMATFRLSADPEVKDLSDGDQIRYQVKLRLVSPSGVFVGAGIGEASSNEEKYKWRAAVCAEEFDEAPIDRKREKWNKGRYDDRSRSYGAPYKVQQIRTEPADLANTILKMAKKRAQIDAVLTATAASDIFTQDLEDLPPEYLDGSEQPAPKGSKAPRAKSQPRQNAQSQGSTTTTNSGMATDKQVGMLRIKLKQHQKDEGELLAAFGIGALENLPFAKVNDAIAFITGN